MKDFQDYKSQSKRIEITTPRFYYSLKTLEMTHSKLTIKGRAYVGKNKSIMSLNFRKTKEKNPKKQKTMTGNPANHLNTAFFIYL